MSTAEGVRPGSAAGVDPGAPVAPHSSYSGSGVGGPAAQWRFLRSELRLVFGRRRNLAGLAVLATVPIIIAVAIKLTASQPGSGAPDFFSAITSNGLFVSLAALTLEIPFFLPLAVGIIAGDSIAGEANIGTLRYVLTVPVLRLRLVAVKYVAVLIFAVTAALLVTVVGAVIGSLLFGLGDLTLLSGTQVGLGNGIFRILVATVYVGLCLASLGAIGLFFSTLTEQPIGAGIAVIIVNILSFICDQVPQLSWVQPYLPTHWWISFGEAFRDPIAWGTLGHGLFVALVYIVVFWLLAWARLADKDVTS